MKIYKLQGNTVPHEFVLFISQTKPILYPTQNLEIESIQKITKLIQQFISFMTKKCLLNIFILSLLIHLDRFIFYFFSFLTNVFFLSVEKTKKNKQKRARERENKSSFSFNASLNSKAPFLLSEKLIFINPCFERHGDFFFLFISACELHILLKELPGSIVERGSHMPEEIHNRNWQWRTSTSYLLKKKVVTMTLT